MGRPRKQPERQPSCPITLGYGDRFHGYLYVGKKANGKDDYRHRSGKDYKECARKIIELEDEIAARKGVAPEPGQSPLLADAIWAWFRAGEAVERWKYNAARDYRLAIRDYIVPNAGHHRLAAFTATTRHAKAMLAAVTAQVSANAARKAHRVLRSFLSDCEEDDVVTRNVMKAISEPKVDEAEEEWLTVAEGRAILEAIARRPRNRSRWLMAVSLGQRQGECLGLMWKRPGLRGDTGDVDLKKGTITIREKLLRKKWQHGCGNPVRCNKTRERDDGSPYNPCRTQVCEPLYHHGCGNPATCGRKLARYCPSKVRKGPCYRHVTKDGYAKECPKPCLADCAQHASTCPKRAGGGLVRESPKSRAGSRTVKMFGPLLEAFKDTKAAQDAERERARNLWTETGYVHTTELGGAIDPKADWEEWQKLLAEAGVDPIKLHAARHYAATILLLLKVEKRLIMHILGWSSDMTKRYQHILDEMLEEAAGQIEAFYWPSAETVKPKKKGKKKKKDKSRKQYPEAA